MQINSNMTGGSVLFIRDKWTRFILLFYHIELLHSKWYNWTSNKQKQLKINHPIGKILKPPNEVSLARDANEGQCVK